MEVASANPPVSDLRERERGPRPLRTSSLGAAPRKVPLKKRGAPRRLTGRGDCHFWRKPAFFTKRPGLGTHSVA